MDDFVKKMPPQLGLDKILAGETFVPEPLPPNFDPYMCEEIDENGKVV